MKIYAGNLQYTTTEDDLQKMFEEFGEVASVKVIIDRYTGRSKGFGFIDMPNDEEAEQAIQKLNGREIDGRPMKINQSIEKKEGDRPPRNNYGRRDNNSGGYGRRDNNSGNYGR